MPYDRPQIPLLLLPAICCVAPAQTDTHISIAHAVIDLLSETELCLNNCRDAQSVQSSLPRLRELAAQARKLLASQAMLEDSSVQDDMAASALVKDFSLLWEAIQQHIARLEKDGLMSPELREILCIAPEK